MKAEELRIGNLVCHKADWSYRQPRQDYEEFNFAWEDSDFYALLECTISLDIIEPIPLTEEWHNKFGISKNGFGNYVYDIPNNKSLFIQIVFNNDYVSTTQGIQKIDDIVNIWNKDLTKRDMYVHEWQNLYFALTGEELTIKSK